MTLLRVYINQELNNKLFAKVLTEVPRMSLVNNFKFAEVKFIKNVISLELLCAVRPKVSAVIWRKKLLIRLRTNTNLEFLSYLQRTPIVWSRYLNASLNLTSNFYPASITVKNNQLAITAILKKPATRQEIYIKSAYLD
ncbi:hypothetical protein EON73_01930 [bacterium]|nr:MAG: hypothetical protein EON73_01930 [bacterium]